MPVDRPPCGNAVRSFGHVGVDLLRLAAERPRDRAHVLHGPGVVDPARLELDQQVGELLGGVHRVDRERVVRGEQLGDHVAGVLGEGRDLRDVGVDEDVAAVEAATPLRVVEGRVDVDVHHAAMLPPPARPSAQVCRPASRAQMQPARVPRRGDRWGSPCGRWAVETNRQVDRHVRVGRAGDPHPQTALVHVVRVHDRSMSDQHHAAYAPSARRDRDLQGVTSPGVALPRRRWLLTVSTKTATSWPARSEARARRRFHRPTVSYILRP